MLAEKVISGCLTQQIICCRTGHHKTDCACVVCAGVRRKLARDGKLGDLGTKPEAVFYSKVRGLKVEVHQDSV